jgi:predicted RNA-binding Zn ribbon-like protein
MNDRHDTAHPEPERPSDLFVEFANTLELEDGLPVDHVGEPARLAKWLEQNGVAPRLPAARVQPAMPAFRELRSLVRDVVARLAAGVEPTAPQLRRLNAVMREGLHYHQVRRAADGARYTIGQVGDELDQARAAIAGSLAHYLADHDVDRLRVCANEGCRWLFVDRSPAGRRRWCDMRVCGNRAKVARHRARARSAPAADARA